MMGPRVLIVAPRLDLGGAEIHLLRVLPRLRQSGLDVGVFTIACGGLLERDLVAAGVSVCGTEVSGPRLWRCLRAAQMLRAEIRRSKPDILHYFLPEPAFVGALASFGMRGLTRIMSRRSLALYRHDHPLLAAADRRISRAADILIGNSAAVAAELVDDCGDRRKVGIIHNGVDIPPPVTSQMRGTSRAGLGIADSTFVMAVIANLIPYKGHADLLAALGLISARLKGPWRLVLVGKDQGLMAGLTAQATALGIGDNILWLGERSDVQQILVAADLGILPSHQEGFSNSVIEMMAQGLPVIATRIGGNVDAIVSGECGFLVPVGDPPNLGEAIVAVYENAELRGRFAAAARHRVQRLFPLELCVRRYRSLYRSVGRQIPAAKMIDPPELNDCKGGQGVVLDVKSKLDRVQ